MDEYYLICCGFATLKDCFAHKKHFLVNVSSNCPEIDIVNCPKVDGITANKAKA